MKQLDWYNLHGEGWGDLLIPDSYAHPAKVKRALARCIYAHLFERGYIERGDTVVDPFAGIAGFALHAMQNGLHWIGVELEPRFFILGGTGMDCPGFNAAFYRRYNQRGKKWHKLGVCPACGHALDDYVPFAEFFGTITRRIPRPEAHHYSGNIEEWEKFNFPGTAVLLQGDSRRLCEVVREAGVIVSSPPYAESSIRNDANYADEKITRAKMANETAQRATWGYNRGSVGQDGYGCSDGQLAAMPPGNYDAIISSPPHAGSATAKSSDGIDLRKQYETYQVQGGGASFEAFCATQRLHSQEYGNSEGQLAAMREGELGAVVSSPPYIEALSNPSTKIEHTGTGGPIHPRNYGSSPGQLANLPVGDAVTAICSSPPYEQAINPQGGGVRSRRQNEKAFKTPGNAGMLASDYGTTDGQLGQETGETFWSAARTIMQQCHAILKPGGVAVWVCKRFVRKKRIVEFSQQWAQLGEACGFETTEWIRAWLVEDRGTQFDLFGNLDKRTVERKSFFRRLYEKKYPGNSIDWEDVIVQRKL